MRGRRHAKTLNKFNVLRTVRERNENGGGSESGGEPKGPEGSLS
jgi:hypothetical protein